MYRLISCHFRRLPSTSGIVAALIGSFLTIPANDLLAQTTVYTDQYGNPTVTVDLRVLDQLGPQQNLPDIYKKPTPLPRRPVMATTTPSAPSGGRGLLAPPPRTMPQSKLNLPRTALPAKARDIPTRPSTGILARPSGTVRSAPTRTVSPPAPARLTERTPTATPPKLGAPAAIPQRSAPPTMPKRVIAPPQPPEAPTTPATPLAAPRAPSATLVPPKIAPPRAVAAPKPVARAPQVVAPPPAPTPPSTAIRPPATVSAPAIKPPQPTAALARPQPVRPVSAGKIAISPDGNLYSIPFAPGSNELPENANAALGELAKRMKADENIRIQLMGFAAASSGSASQARRSSLFRALSIRTFLMKEGVRTTRMDVRALGQTSVEGVPPDRVDIILQQP